MILGTILLSDHLVLEGVETAKLITANLRRTITGRAVVQVAHNISGRSLSLVSESHLTLQDIIDIKAIEAQGDPVPLVHARGVFSVLITGLDVTQVFSCSNPAVDEWYSGNINLLEV